MDNPKTKDTKNLLKEKLAAIVAAKAAAAGVVLGCDFDANAVHLERPKRDGQGDWASNIAMQLCKAFAMPPKDLAQEIIKELLSDPLIEGAQSAGPGFLNITLTKTWVDDLIKEIFAQGENYGRVDDSTKSLKNLKKIQIEFVSANPTGPLHLGHGRGAAVGDIMCSILSAGGHYVEREYYINDAGLQMENLGKSARSRYFELLGRSDEAPFPEDGYKGDYISDIAQKILDLHGAGLAEQTEEDTLTLFTDTTSKLVLEMIKADLEEFGVAFDVWFSEKSVYEDTQVQDTVAALKERGYAYDHDGAVWFKSTAFGDDKDRVLIRSNGAPTYFMSDIVYHKNKYDRGFDLLINVWGADHHGYIPRMKSAVCAMGRAPEDLEIMLIQMVNLLRDGVPVTMSKRAGTFVTLKEVMEEVGKDAARFFFVSRRCDSHLDFDLELAKRATSDNPVFYVQYAHARICSILREAEARGLPGATSENFKSEHVALPQELALATVLSRYPEEIERACVNLTPHSIAYYATEIAEAFHSFYNAAHIIGSEEPIRSSRLALAKAAQITLSNVLTLLGVSAPEKM